ncbi:hypothetical protein KGQ19_25240 [Catenulispora sp. NL8]|uniref:Uncharacterized protein n=1 Tax=Catenulispora pinistramenti TaxID=2705254 RepID=A0ABS5KVT2_9ACTN|nr:hypothetical protein [Catenulispora pinistramenti]MBS2550177.1 hypothetical protein [Catenulispora pinistramenti]
MSAQQPSIGRISVGRDLNGAIVVADDASVVLNLPHDPPPAQPHQQNTAKDHGTVYTVAQGDLYIQQTAQTADTGEPDEDACRATGPIAEP